VDSPLISEMRQVLCDHCCTGREYWLVWCLFPPSTAMITEHLSPLISETFCPQFFQIIFLKYHVFFDSFLPLTTKQTTLGHECWKSGKHAVICND